MKVAAMALMVGAAVEASQPQQKLTVYLLDNGVVPVAFRAPALDLAGKMFATIGVRLDWRRGEPPRTSSTRPIVVDLTSRTPVNLRPGALAYAQPYEGVHIRVFYDRVESVAGPSLRTAVLAHVLVHEITHIAQRVCRHSDSGVMKAVWTDRDYFQMRTGVLPFTPQDVELIHLGLASRASGDSAGGKD
jgi:hypothetical protein